ncbi:hypothetical protein Tco_1490433 [Tanacetum coccineum]
MNKGSPADRPGIPTLANMLNKSIFLTSNTNFGQDRKVHSYCVLRLADIPAADAGTSSASKYAHTHNEIKNRMSAFMSKQTPETIDKNIVASLIQMLDQTSVMAKSFRMAKEWCRSHGDANFGLRLLSERTATRQYNTPTVSESHGALDLGSTRFLKNMISMKNEGTAEVFEGTEEVHEGTAQVNESTAEKIKVPLLFVKVPLVLSDILERTACFIRYRVIHEFWFLDGFGSRMLRLRGS